MQRKSGATLKPSENKMSSRRNSAKKKIIECSNLINDELANYGTFSELEKRTGIPKVYLASGFFIALLLMLVLGMGFQILGHMISLLWPAYRSYVVIDALEKMVIVKQKKDEEPKHAFGRSKKDQLAELDAYENIRKQLTMRPLGLEFDNIIDVELCLRDQRKKLMDQCHGKAKKYLMYWVVYGVLYLSEYIFNVLMWWLPFYWILKVLFLLWCVHPKYEGSVTVYNHMFAPILRKRKVFIESWIATAREITKTTFDEFNEDCKPILASPTDIYNQVKIKARKFTSKE